MNEIQINALSELISKRCFIFETTIPEIINFPEHYIDVSFKIINGKIIIYWDRYDSFEEQQINETIEIDKSDILSIKVLPKSNIDNPDSHWNKSLFPEIIFRHKDPNGIIEFFKSSLKHDQSYSIKALKKYIEINIGIDLIIEHI